MFIIKIEVNNTETNLTKACMIKTEKPVFQPDEFNNLLQRLYQTIGMTLDAGSSEIREEIKS